MDELMIREQIAADMARDRVTYAELANRTGLTVAQLKYRVNGRSKITVDDFNRIARAFGHSPAQYMQRTLIAA